MKTTKPPEEKNRGIAYSYIRFSTPSQSKSGESLRRQIQAGKKWCKENGYQHADETFFDAGRSGYAGKNLSSDKEGRAKGELRRFLNLVEAGTIKPGSILLLESYDRFSRLKPVESYSHFLNLINAGIGLVFTMSYEKRVITADLLNGEPHLLQMVMGECIRAHAESARKSQMIKSVRGIAKERIQDGQILRHNGVPKYFSWNDSTQRYEHNKSTELVKQLVEEYLSGKSLYQISGELNKKKIRTIKTQTEWAPRTISGILRSRCLVGEYLSNPKFLDPIIDNDTFQRLQVRLHQNEGNRGQRAEYSNIFRGLLCCQCGKKMNILSQSLDYRTKKKWKNSFRYYRCASISAGSPCPHTKVIHADKLELDFFLGYLQQSPGDILRATAKQETSKVTLLQTQLAKADKDISQATELLGLVSVAELKTKLVRLENRRQAIKADLDKANIETFNTHQSPQALESIKTLLQRMGYEGEQTNTPEYALAVQRIQRHLANPITRNEMRQLLPGIVSKIIIDSDAKRYAVVNLSGVQSDWRALTMPEKSGINPHTV